MLPDSLALRHLTPTNNGLLSTVASNVVEKYSSLVLPQSLEVHRKKQKARTCQPPPQGEGRGPFFLSNSDHANPLFKALRGILSHSDISYCCWYLGVPWPSVVYDTDLQYLSKQPRQIHNDCTKLLSANLILALRRSE